MLLWSFRPPLLSGTMGSTSQSLQSCGLGWIRLNSATALRSCWRRPRLSREQISHSTKLRLRTAGAFGLVLRCEGTDARSGNEG